MSFDDRPDMFPDLRRGGFWYLAGRTADERNFRRRLMLGWATADGWPGDETLDVYVRVNPETGQEIWSIWQFHGMLRMGRRQVWTIYDGPPNDSHLRQLMAGRDDRHDINALIDQHQAEVRRDAISKSDAIEEELRERLRWMATSRHSPIQVENA